MIYKAPREVRGFTTIAMNELKTCVAPNNWNHSVDVIKIDNNIAILKIHKFRIGKGKPAKDYYASVKVTAMWGDRIRAFEDYRVINENA